MKIEIEKEWLQRLYVLADQYTKEEDKRRKQEWLRQLIKYISLLEVKLK